MNFVKFLTTPFSQNTSRRLVLIAGFNPGQTWVLFIAIAGFSKTQLTWIKSTSRPTLPNLAGSFKKSIYLKSQLFSGFAGFVAKTTIELDSLWVLEPS